MRSVGRAATRDRSGRAMERMVDDMVVVYAMELVQMFEEVIAMALGGGWEA